MLRERRFVRFVHSVLFPVALLAVPATLGSSMRPASQDSDALSGHQRGRRLFEDATFGGNGRTCRTCHSRETGTVSPEDAQRRFIDDPTDPLFRADGSDDGRGNGVTRMLTDATIRVSIPLPEYVTLANAPKARTVVLHRGIRSTLNTPRLDPLLMSDGRHRDLTAQALAAIADHAQPARLPDTAELKALVAFELSSRVTDPAIDGDPPIDLTEQDQQDIVAFLKVLR